MAGADYRHCDVCGGKAFYDANLNYEQGRDSDRKTPPYRVVGEDQYATKEFNDKYGMHLDCVGDWAVVCEDCAKTHRTLIVPIDRTDAANSRPEEP